MKEQWKKQMQQKMADYRESDIEVSWAELEEALAANRQKTARVIPLWGRRVAAATAILLLAGTGFWLLRQQETDVHKPSLTQEKSIPSEQSAHSAVAPVNTVETLVSQVTPRPTRKPGASITPLTESPLQETDPSKQSVTSAESVPSAEPVPSVEPVPSAESLASAEPETPVDKVESAPQADSSLHISHSTFHIPPCTPHTPHSSRLTPSSSRLTAKVYLSNTMSDSHSTESYVLHDRLMDVHSYYSITPNQRSNEEYVLSPHSGASSSNTPVVVYDTIYIDKYSQIDNHVHHHQPVHVGLSLRYRINDRWSIESGLTYSHHSSDITTSVDEKTIATTEQRLDYLGIPVSASYQLWGARYFNFYLSAGGMVEKMMKGRQTTYGKTASVSIRPLQLSLNGAAGVEFRFFKDFSLYAEPALGYYFDNGSRISTYYQEKPFNFNINVGLRFSLNR